MADLTELSERADSELPGTNLRSTSTQEVLELRGVQGIAWRSLENREVLQLYPPSAKREAFRDGPFLVVRDSESECSYRDPGSRLYAEQWGYVGCSECSSLADNLVSDWIRGAYENLRRNRGSRIR